MPRTVPTTITHIPSDLITASDYNTYAGAANTFLTTPPIFMGYQVAAQSIPNNTDSAVGFDAELVDSDSGHSNVSSNSRYTCQVAGWYAISGTTAYVANATGVRLAYFKKNGTAVQSAFGEYNAAASGVTSVPVSTALVQLNVNDYVELWTFQNSGGSLNTSTSTQSTNSMSVWWIAHV